jgi:hypothetical protein
VVAVNKNLICKCVSRNNQPDLKCNYCAYGKDKVTPSNFYWVLVWFKQESKKYGYHPDLCDIVHNNNHCKELQDIRDMFLKRIKSGQLTIGLYE